MGWFPAGGSTGGIGAGGTPEALRDETSTGVARSSNVVEKIALERLRAELDSLFEPSTRVLRKGKASKPDELAKLIRSSFDSVGFEAFGTGKDDSFQTSAAWQVVKSFHYLLTDPRQFVIL